MSKEKRRQIVSLALSVRARVDPEEVVEWLYTVWKTGRDPLSSDLQPTEGVIDLKTRKDCLEMLLNRGWGMPAQHVVVEADVRTAVMGEVPPVPVPSSLGDVRARRDALRNAGVKRRVIETTAFERAEIEAGSVNGDESEEDK
jgi:hypothetical protein